MAPVPKAAKAPAAPIAPIAPFKLAAELRTSTIAGILNRGTSLGNFAAAGGAVLPTLLDQVVFHKNRFRQLTIAVLAIAPAQTVDFTANQVESCSAGLWLVSPAQVLKVLEDPQNLAYPALAIAMGYPLPQDDKASAAAMVKVPAAPASVYVYTGKENQTDSQGNTWIPETSDKKNLAIGGGTLSHPAKPVPVITNTKDPALYQSERFGSSFSYTFSHLPPGYYTITLKFAEIVHIDKKSNQGVRIFNVSVNGAQVLTDFDIAADAGADVPDDYSFTDIVPDGKGQIEVQFTGTKGADTNAKISAISIEPQWGNAAAARALSSSGEFPNFYLRLAELAQQGFAGSAFLPMRLRVSENEMDGLTATAVSILGPDETQNGIVSSLIMQGNRVSAAVTPGDADKPTYLAAVAIASVARCVVTGNMILNAAPATGREFAFMLDDNYAAVPSSAVPEPEIMVSANVFQATIHVVPEHRITDPGIPPALTRWEFLNTIITKW